MTDLFETVQESWSSLDEVSSQVLSCSIIHVKSNITLPEREDFTHNVVFKEFHTGEDVEHGGLLHPFTQGEEFGWDDLSLGATFSFLLDDVDHTLSRDSEVFTLKSLFGILVIWVDLDEVIWAELVERNWLPLAVDELDWGVVAVLGKEGNSLLTSLNLVEELPNVSTLTDIVGSSGLRGLVLAGILGLFDDASELFEEVLVAIFHFVLLFHALHLSILLFHFFIHLHVVHHLLFWNVLELLHATLSVNGWKRCLVDHT